MLLYLLVYIQYEKKLMLRPISHNYLNFSADIRSRNPLTGEYKDPLMRWPLRGAAFTNEVGEALRPLIGGYATLSWAPALLYIGADVYDKYKNDQTEYSPDSRRCLKQAIFQGMASILLPIIAVKGGQNLFSLFGIRSKDKITYNTQEQIIELAQQFVANGKMRAYHGKDEECIKAFMDVVDNNIDYKETVNTIINPFKKGTIKKHNINNKKIVDSFSQNIIQELIDTRKSLLNPTEEFEKSSLYTEFKNALKTGETKNVAVKTVLNKQLSRKTMQGRLIKTVGGFIALGLAINPIDKFVENVLIGKVIGPSIDKTKRPTN